MAEAIDEAKAEATAWFVGQERAELGRKSGGNERAEHREGRESLSRGLSNF